MRWSCVAFDVRRGFRAPPRQLADRSSSSPRTMPPAHIRPKLVLSTSGLQTRGRRHLYKSSGYRLVREEIASKRPATRRWAAAYGGPFRRSCKPAIAPVGLCRAKRRSDTAGALRVCGCAMLNPTDIYIPGGWRSVQPWRARRRGRCGRASPPAQGWPISCSDSGRPSCVKPAGMAMAGWPVALNGWRAWRG